jgi:uncharacterized membrane protein YphA (DoxX/SURF4 family)
MKTLIDWLIGWPERVAQHLGSLAPLFARIVVGWVFLWSRWGKLNNLPAMIENFAGWHIPAPHILTMLCARSRSRGRHCARCTRTRSGPSPTTPPPFRLLQAACIQLSCVLKLPRWPCPAALC